MLTCYLSVCSPRRADRSEGVAFLTHRESPRRCFGLVWVNLESSGEGEKERRQPFIEPEEVTWREAICSLVLLLPGAFLSTSLVRRAATAELMLWGQRCSLGPSVGPCSGHNLVSVSWLPQQPLLSALPTFSTHSDPRSEHSLLGDRQDGWREWRLWDGTLLEGVVVSFPQLIWAHGFGGFSLCSVGPVAFGSGSTSQKGCAVGKTTHLIAKEWERVGFHNPLGGQTPSDLKTSH